MTSGKSIKVAAVMTAPRYECVAARNEIERVFHTLGIPLTISGGVFYHQCMQQMLEGLAKADVDYVVTVDFDSIFTPDHLQRLLNIIANDDQIDALAPVQPKRSVGTVMATTGQGESLDWDGSPIKVRTAHFGLTVLDLHKLAAVPRPWFLSLPDADGGWGDGRTDADVYFWREWEKAGNSLYLDPGTKLGHLEEMVAYYDDEMQLRHEYLSKWREQAGTTKPCEPLSL